MQRVNRRAAEYAGMLSACHSPRHQNDSRPGAKTLRTAKFRVAIRGAIGFRPFDCAFREQEI
jgi:hypothetical protein